MISTLLIISFGCLYNADLVKPEQPPRCRTNLDCNTGQKCSLFEDLGRSVPLGGLCVEVPKTPSPTPRFRMCLLPGMINKMDRSMMPDLQIDIVRCEAYELCMTIKSGDTSNIGGFGLGMCQSRKGPQPPPTTSKTSTTSTTSTTTITTVGPTTTTEVRPGMNLCDPLMKKNGYEINMVICEANEICQPLSNNGELAKIGTCKPTGEPMLGKLKACMVGGEEDFGMQGRSAMFLQFDIYKCSPDNYCKPFGSTGISAILGKCTDPTAITTRGPTLGPVIDPDTTTDYYDTEETSSSEEKEVAPRPFTDQMCFVNQDMARNSPPSPMLLNIQIVRCKSDEICDPAEESQYYGNGLGKCKQGNVVDVARAAGKFKTLLKILSELEVPSLRSMTLVDILKMQRQVTVFAPTDEAFAKLPEGTLESLTKEQKLAIVSRHFIPGVAIFATDFDVGYKLYVETFGGEQIMLSNIKGVFGGSYKGNYISVVSQDVKASNGVIHVIDEVMLPGNVVDVAKAAGNFTTLLKILSELEVPSLKSMTLLDILKMQREVTIYAPTDEAFAKLPEGTLESLTDEQKLAIVSRHFVTGVIALAADIPTGLVETFGGEKIFCINNKGMVSISYEGNLISVVTPDVMASNGVIHVTDKVILPPPVTTTVAPPPTPILPGLNLCIPNLFETGGRRDEPHAEFNIVMCGAHEVCQKIADYSGRTETFPFPFLSQSIFGEIPKIGEGLLGQFGTCKPKGDKLRVTVCLTGNGNKKSLPFFQYLIVECGADEFCEPVPMNFDGLGKCRKDKKGIPDILD